METPTAKLPPVHDRRRQRSKLPYEAARLYLRALRYRRGLRAVALGDDDGFVVVGSGDPRDVEYLTYLGVLPRMNPSLWRDEVEAFAPGMPFFSLRLDLGGRVFRLSGVGSVELQRDEVGMALKRILEASLT